MRVGEKFRDQTYPLFARYVKGQGVIQRIRNANAFRGDHDQILVVKFLVVREMSAIETLKELVKLAFSILCSLTILAAGLVLLLALLEQSVRFL